DGIRDFHVTGVQTCALPISILQYLARTEWTIGTNHGRTLLQCLDDDVSKTFICRSQYKQISMCVPWRRIRLISRQQHAVCDAKLDRKSAVKGNTVDAHGRRR